MNSKAFATSLMMLLAMASRGDEILPVLKANQQTYTNATILKVTATDIYFVSSQGMGNAKLKDLDPALQKHFHYSATNAVAVDQKYALANAEYRAQAANAPAAHPPNEEREVEASDAPAPALLWTIDLPTAISQARSENKMVLIDFTGSDWCEWCMKFDHDILSTDKFENYAKDKLELVQLDYPHHKPQSDELKQANQQLAQKFEVNGFPTFVLLNSDGNEIGRQVGYLDGGPNAFIAELENFSKK